MFCFSNPLIKVFMKGLVYRSLVVVIAIVITIVLVVVLVFVFVVVVLGVVVF